MCLVQLDDSLLRDKLTMFMTWVYDYVTWSQLLQCQGAGPVAAVILFWDVYSCGTRNNACMQCLNIPCRIQAFLAASHKRLQTTMRSLTVHGMESLVLRTSLFQTWQQKLTLTILSQLLLCIHPHAQVIWPTASLKPGIQSNALHSACGGVICMCVCCTQVWAFRFTFNVLIPIHISLIHIQKLTSQKQTETWDKRDWTSYTFKNRAESIQTHLPCRKFHTSKIQDTQHQVACLPESWWTTSNSPVVMGIEQQLAKNLCCMHTPLLWMLAMQ